MGGVRGEGENRDPVGKRDVPLCSNRSRVYVCYGIPRYRGLGGGGILVVVAVIVDVVRPDGQ